MTTLFKRFILIVILITPIVLLINHSFTSKAKDAAGEENKTTKTEKRKRRS